MGGGSTTGLMSHWTGNTQGGVYAEILARSNRPGSPYGLPPDFAGQVDWPGLPYAIDPERLKTLYLDMLSEADVTLRTYTFASRVIQEDHRVHGVITESKSGPEAFLADVVVDCTGDGDIAALAGAGFTKGRSIELGNQRAFWVIFKGNLPIDT